MTPYWWTLKTGGEINPKYPGGVKEQKEYLKAEGRKVMQKKANFLLKIMENIYIVVNNAKK